MEPISERIYTFFYKHKGYKNDTVIAKELGYSHPEKISRLFREGKAAKPSVDILEDITNTFGEELSIEWVLTGKGEMLRPDVVFSEGKSIFIATAKKPGPEEPGDHLLTLLNQELKTMRASLEKLEKAATVTAHSGTKQGRVSERLALGKTEQGALSSSKKRTLKGNS